MIIETQDEKLHEVEFVNPNLTVLGNKFLSVTFTEQDRTEFLKSPWKKVTNFEAACAKYLFMVI